MTITSYGYPGSVDKVGHYLISRFAGSKYNVFGATDCKVTRITSGSDRSVTVAPGLIHAAGVTADNDATVIVGPLPTVSSGERWDLIVANYDFTAKATTFTYVTGSSSRAVPAHAIDVATGVVQQPLALVRIVAGQQYPQDVVDLRAHLSAGGALAYDVLALNYITQPGLRIRIGGVDWTYQPNPVTGTYEWINSIIPPPPAQVRGWQGFRTTTDVWVNEGNMTGTTFVGPAGDYLIMGSASIRNNHPTGTAACAKRIRVNGNPVGLDEQDDLPSQAFGWVSRQHSAIYYHPGGTFSVLYIVSNNLGATVQSAYVNVAYLGSRT